MLSALILTGLSYPAMPRTGQPVHQRSMHSGPLVLGVRLRKFRTPTADKDRTVSRRSEPSSRAVLIGEQPNPWDLLQPQDTTSRHRTFSIISNGADYIFILHPYFRPKDHILGSCVEGVGVLQREKSRSLPFRVSRYGVKRCAQS
jgi:hypothetical protein